MYGKKSLIKKSKSLLNISRRIKFIQGCTLCGIAAVLPSMRERKEGHIINVTSIDVHLVFPAGSVYSGTKFAVRAITE